MKIIFCTTYWVYDYSIIKNEILQKRFYLNIHHNKKMYICIFILFYLVPKSTLKSKLSRSKNFSHFYH